MSDKFNIKINDMIQSGICLQIAGNGGTVPRHTYCNDQTCRDCFLSHLTHHTIKELKEFCIEHNIEITYE